MSLLSRIRRLRANPALLRPSFPLFLATPFPSSLIHRLLLSTTQPPSPNPQFATEYLIRSCGLSPNKALRASRYLQHLKSPDKPDAVLRFLRQTGISEPDIQTAVSRDPLILCSHVDKNWRPNVAKLQELGLSTKDISCIISRSPGAFRFNSVPKIDFWMRALGSVEHLFMVLKRRGKVLHSNLEKVAIPNMSFLQEQCGLSVPQIVRLMKSAPRAITYRPEVLKIKAKRAEELGVRCSSPMFVYALIIVCSLNQRTIDARLNNFKTVGFSREELTILIRRLPLVLFQREEMMSHKVEFLTKELGCDMLQLVSTPSLLTCSLEKRLIPRSLVWKLLKLKGLLGAIQKFASFVAPSESRFLEKFVLSYEHAIPGLHQAYASACSGDITGIKWFKSILS